MATVRSIEGALLGMAIGDALGLPYENLSPQRAARMLGPPDRFRFAFGKGMVSDDTEHACLTAQALLAAGNDDAAFARSLAWGLRRWMALLPAGTGMATARACLKLLVGFSPARSGVFSAGNGPAMRAPLLGAAVDDPGQLQRLVAISTRITHTDAKAEFGALAVALAAHTAARSDSCDPASFLHMLQAQLAGQSADELLNLVRRAAESAGRGESAIAFAQSLGLSRGVTGYIYHTVPVVLQAWFRHPRDYRAAVNDVLLAGGDADSTGAIVGGIVGAAVGKQGLPSEWLAGLCDWPLGVRWIEKLAAELGEARATGAGRSAPALPVWGVLPRNLLFLAIVLLHGLRRLAPPY